MDKLDNIGKLFGQRRVELGMTQAEVGDRMGVGRATISKIESGKGLTFDTINRMANALEADVKIALTPKVMHGKEVIEYIVTAISEFSKRHVLTIKEASNYLLRFKGIEFLEQCYAAEHTLSVKDWVDDITAICKRNGGGIEIEETRGTKGTMEKNFQFLLEAISTDIIGWLIRDNRISLSEAISTWYNSETFEKVSGPKTGMYIESPAYNYEFLKRELQTGRFSV